MPSNSTIDSVRTISICDAATKLQMSKRVFDELVRRELIRTIKVGRATRVPTEVVEELQDLFRKTGLLSC
jgi:hypothetical protein